MNVKWAVARGEISMMDGGMWGVGSMGEYGGILLPILLVVAGAVLASWIIKQRGK
jgi:hypothetical protein